MGGEGGCRNSLHFYWSGQKERSSTNMQIIGIGNLSLGLIIALKISPFFSHPSNFGGCSEKRNRKNFLFLFWAIARDKSSFASHTR